EIDRVDDRYHPPLRLGERQRAERPSDALDSSRVAERGALDADVGHVAIATDGEFNRDAPAQGRSLPEPILVAQPKATVILPNNALNDLRGEPAVYLDRSGPDARRGRAHGGSVKRGHHNHRHIRVAGIATVKKSDHAVFLHLPGIVALR